MDAARPATPAEQVAGALIALVRDKDIEGGREEDTAAYTMHAAYVRALRRFTRLREIAATGAGEEAVILVRAFLSLCARAMWVDAPTDPLTRQGRWQSYAKRNHEDRIKTMELMQAGGFEVDESVLRDEHDQLAKRADAKGFPDDRQLLEQLGMNEFYAPVYRLSSDYAHFSLGVAFDDIHGREEVLFDKDDSELAIEALVLAIVIYGLFLHISDKTVRHGLNEQVQTIILKYDLTDTSADAT